jgi:hypothetical protein|tara:strand:+ start:2100 stop:3533 length:1434 start_codon:yes stop_codon:yes gene_type:complete
MGIIAKGVNASGFVGTPAPVKQTTANAYLDLANTANQGWAQQYLPDLMEKEAEIYGNRSLAGFLEQVGAEEASAADQVVWSEQGRLHISASGVIDASEGIITSAGHAVRLNDTVLINQAAKGSLRCLVTVVTDDTFTVKPYTQATTAATNTDAATTVTMVDGAVVGFVYGSEFVKGAAGRAKAVEPEFKSLSNQMMIMKDLYEVSGSDASQIGWVEVSGEEGQSGYMWYLKAAGDTRARFADYCEMSMIESVKKDTLATHGGVGVVANLKGHEGLWSAIDNRGLVAETATDNVLTLAEFDLFLKEFDKQGAIEEYMMFLDRGTALAVDDLLATLSTSGNGGGAAYGVFDNDADMALNLGFSGFRRGSYDFYKTDWKYLNDQGGRGAIVGSSAVDVKKGLFVPAGVSTVYDQALGKNLKRPFLHVRYRASQMEDRKFKTWTTGSVGAATSDIDAMEMHFLTERCLIVQGANNFMTLVG